MHNHIVCTCVTSYHCEIQGVFFNWASPLDWPPPNLLGLAPTKFSKCWNHIHLARHLDVFRSKGGPVWDSDGFFLNQLLTSQHLANSGWGQLKKHPVNSSVQTNFDWYLIIHITQLSQLLFLLNVYNSVESNFVVTSVRRKTRGILTECNFVVLYTIRTAKAVQCPYSIVILWKWIIFLSLSLSLHKGSTKKMVFFRNIS